jgi:hypothetical protein
MGKTEGEPDCSSLTRALGQRFVGRIAIDLQDARIVDQLRRDLILAAAVREHVGHSGWRWSSPRSVIHRMSPELTDLGAAPSGIENRHRGLVAKEWRGVDGSQLEFVEPLQPHHDVRFTQPARVERSRWTP